MSKIRKITKIDAVDDLGMPDNDEEVHFFVQYDETMQQIMLSVMSKLPMSPEDYMSALAAFVNDTSEFPETLFVEEIDSDLAH